MKSLSTRFRLSLWAILALCLAMLTARIVDKKLFLLRSDPDDLSSTTELIRSKGYLAEEHEFTTQDGYIITVHRIPNAKGKHGVSTGKPVALLLHGLNGASHTFTLNFPEQSLGFLLADEGFDVWLANVRGNTYGLRHVSLNTSQEEFWAFSWPEMARYVGFLFDNSYL